MRRFPPNPNPSPRERIRALDALRGAMILGMIVDHIVFDLQTYLGIFEGAMTHPLRMALHYVGAYLFVMLSGASASISRSNVRRGLQLLGISLGVTLVTWLFNPACFVVFGILHCLAVCAIVYGLAKPWISRIPNRFAPLLWVSLSIVFKILTDSIYPTSEWWWIFGFESETFVSADFYPLVPWIFVYLFGTWAGPYIFAHKLPDWFYRIKCESLETVGRWSLWIYIAHQPIVLGIVLLIRDLYFK